MNMNLIRPFMMGGNKTPYKLKQTCIFQQLDCVSVSGLFLPSGMKVLKGKTVYKINGLLISNILVVLVHKHVVINFIVHTKRCGGFPN